jgi:hypothetical protein
MRTDQRRHAPRPRSPSGPKVVLVHYVALGDSYASGEGIAPYVPGAGGCRRSSRSYPVLLSEGRP